METKELMIGDWVKLKNGDYYFQVESIYNTGIRIQTCGYFEQHGIDKFVPIPLTQEILEKNGFIRDSAVSVHKSNKIEIVHWSVDNLVFNSCTEDGFPIHIPHLMYVHELQHALRLCGHNDLVDNFKIE